MDARDIQLKETAGCQECGQPATRQITTDPDIRGIPICNESVCEHRARVRLMMVMFADDETEAEGFMNGDMEGFN